MQVTTGGIARAKLLFKLALAAGLSIIALSLLLIFVYRSMERRDLAESQFATHAKTLELLSAESQKQAFAQQPSQTLETLLAAFPSSAAWAIGPDGKIVAKAGSPRIRIPAGYAPSAQPMLADDGGKTIALAAGGGASPGGLRFVIAADITENLARIDSRAWKIAFFAFLFEGALFALLLWMARRGDESLMQSQKEQVAMENELFFLSHYDTVTHLPNRTLFWERMDAAIVRAARLGKSVSLLVFDLDGFKAINEERGRSVGDKALSEVARRLQSCARSNDLISRIGSDEFAILQEDLDPDEIEATRARALEKLARVNAPPCLIDSASIPLPLCCGHSAYPDNGANSEEVLAYAQKQCKSSARRH